ncbi:zinc-ribbon domain containing protein [Lederbergia sp. NSJ-179]|uniref:RQC-minor-1 family DNA-binding protein n=1 Tax=Lederbergia sp. NSJ-179 TaxID=2931402 RepID=UPI001FD1A408|nr:RQC-minor-1 family DNA-binding protein [Lederbergia sp. NSJ-179]MCJ7840464.1 zinc-ribbon domain containing protein [Lederbergia sp. NSJ-179]
MDANIKRLTEQEILAILRAADELIGQGGRTLLAKILKGSREKKVVALQLDRCPVYGYFQSETLAVITEKIDWMISHDFLDIEYFGKLPMIVFTDRGWEIEADQRADEFLSEWNEWLAKDQPIPDMSYLKDRNRKMIFLFLEKVRETGDTKYIPYLEEWKKVDYKKVKAEISTTIHALTSGKGMDELSAHTRKRAIEEALLGEGPQDFLIKCWECGKRFTFTIGEQQFYKQRGLSQPKRCEECRLKRKFGEIF